MADSDEKAKDVAVGAAGVATGAIAQYAATVLHVGPELTAAISVFAGAVPGLIQVGFAKRAERRTVAAARGMAAADPEGHTAVPVNERSQETFLSMFYDMMDAVDDAAAAPLGHLAMTYARLDLAPDSFFRSFGRVVRELDGEEIDQLEKLFAECVRRIDAHEASTVDAIVIRTDFRDPSGRNIEARGGGENSWTPIACVQNGIRLLSLLKQHGLALEPTDEPGAYGVEPIKARIWRGVAGRSHMHLMLEPVPPTE